MKKFMGKIGAGSGSPVNSPTSPTANRAYGPPAGPPPQQQQYGYAGGSAQQYYQQAPPSQQYAPPPGPPPQVNQSARPAPAPVATGEDPFATLKKYDTVILVDDSGSMEMFWDETKTALQGVVSKAIQYDEDGIDLHFFNDSFVAQNVHSTQEVSRVFNRIDPRKSTPTAAALSRVLEPYLRSLEAAKQNGGKVKPMNLIVLTDGAPDRGQDPEPVLVDCAKRLDVMRQPLFQLGISFIQIGDDEEAAVHLTSLDDDLKAKHKVRDCIDVSPFSASRGGQITSEFILKALLGGINRRFDKEPLSR